jgi:hypothetical protein
MKMKNLFTAEDAENAEILYSVFLGALCALCGEIVL